MGRKKRSGLSEVMGHPEGNIAERYRTSEHLLAEVESQRRKRKPALLGMIMRAADRERPDLSPRVIVAEANAIDRAKSLVEEIERRLQ